MRPLVLFNWDVLARSRSGAGVGDAVPVEGGVDLYKILGAQWRLVLLYEHDDKEELLRQWLVREGLKVHVGVRQRQVRLAKSPAEWKAAVVNQMRTEGNDEILFVDNDREAVDLVSADGAPTLLVSFPVYQLSGRTLVPWEELVAEIDHQRETRNRD